MRCLSALLLTASTLLAQTAEPPSPATLDRLGLRTVWVNAVPLNGERDGIATVQIADTRQIFVQTKRGLLVAFDAATGERQWTFRYDTADTTPFAVGWNDQYVFAYSVVKLYGIQRVTGVLDFAQNLPLAPSGPPIADDSYIYCSMIGNRLGAFIIPPGLTQPDPRLIKAAGRIRDTSVLAPGLRNPADVVAGRYPSTSRNFNLPPEQFEQRHIRLTAEPAGSFGSTQRTASLSVVATLRPPFSSFDDRGRYLIPSPSLNVVSSLRQPYHLMDPTSKNAQRSPSIAVIPPSLASLYESTSLRPRGIQLEMRWIYGSTVPLTYTPLISRDRIWAFTYTPIVVSLTRDQGQTQVDARLSAQLTAQPGQAEDIGYMPQSDGYLTAVDLNGGSARTVRTFWKSNVGGLMNASPVPTKNAIYQPGTNSGIARVDRISGEVVWRSENRSDRLLALNEEHLYAADSHGRIYVYNQNMVNNVGTKQAYPLATADLPAFTVNITNEETDRIFLASDGGLFICLRDDSPKYAAPMTIAPRKTLPPLKKAEIPGEILPNSK